MRLSTGPDDPPKGDTLLPKSWVESLPDDVRWTYLCNALGATVALEMVYAKKPKDREETKWERWTRADLEECEATLRKLWSDYPVKSEKSHTKSAGRNRQGTTNPPTTSMVTDLNSRRAT